MRLAFVGQEVYFGYTAWDDPSARFFDIRGEWRAALAEYEPDVVVAYRPEYIAPGAFAGLDAVTIGFLTEPLPRPGRPAHPDLEQRLEYLRAADASNFDRIVSYDPHIAATVDPIVPVWRSLPIPVGDFMFQDVQPPHTPPQILFTGRATEHRDEFLDPIKHDFDVVHLAHGVSDERLLAFLADADVGVNLHNEPYPNYENRVSVFCAAGLLVVSEELSPRWGLEPGVDYVEIAAKWELWEVVRQLHRTPDAFRTMRRSARRKAERFRASRVWPALAREAVEDVRAFGSPRRSATVTGA